jgi:fluoride exporter
VTPPDRSAAAARHPHPLSWSIVGAIALGGVIGSLARAGVGDLVGGQVPGFPWPTFLVNVVGAVAIGVVSVLTVAGRELHPLQRPFLATGVLGGFTTFSAFSVDTVRLSDHGADGTALVYVVATIAIGLLAVRVAAVLTRRATGDADVEPALPMADEEA